MSVDWTLTAALVGLGTAALVAATVVARRTPPPARTGRARAVSPLVPWLGSVAVVALAVRGSLAGAGVVLLATVVHAGVARWRVVRPRPTRR